jgi:hypothetical protein
MPAVGGEVLHIRDRLLELGDIAITCRREAGAQHVFRKITSSSRSSVTPDSA